MDKYPKELIALAKESNWDRIKNFIEKFILSTLKEDLPYNVILLEENGRNKEKDSVKNITINDQKDFDQINQVNGFNTLSIYQSDEYISNNLYLTKNRDTIILMAKYMNSINIGTFDCFDFLMMIDSSNTPTFMNTSGDRLESNEIIELFKNYGFKKQLKNIKDLEDKDLEAFIFEELTGKNAVWGNDETKAFKKWKKQVANLYRKETGNYTYYGGCITKNYRIYLEKMFQLWKNLTNCGQREIPSETLNEFYSFMSFI